MNKGRMFVAIGDDGMREVVWGMGGTVDAAMNDARRWEAEGTGNVEIARVVPVDAVIAARIEAGEIDAVELGLGASPAARLGRRGGRARSDAKAAAARENGAKGGRPPRTVP